MSLGKESSRDMVIEPKSSADEVHMHSLQKPNGKELFNVVPSGYDDDAHPPGGNVAISDGNKIKAKLVHTTAKSSQSGDTGV